MEKMGITKSWIFITGLMLAFNIYVSYITQSGKSDNGFFYQLVNISFPVWVSLIVGSLLGYIIALVPRGKQTFTEKLVKGKFIGFMIANALFTFSYIYLLYVTYYNS